MLLLALPMLTKAAHDMALHTSSLVGAQSSGRWHATGLQRRWHGPAAGPHLLGGAIGAATAAPIHFVSLAVWSPGLPDLGPVLVIWAVLSW